jgi:hypothetical protein
LIRYISGQQEALIVSRQQILGNEPLNLVVMLIVIVPVIFLFYRLSFLSFFPHDEKMAITMSRDSTKNFAALSS